MTGAGASRSHQGHLQRRLGLLSAITITAGGVIGSGIFLKPLVIAHAVPDPLLQYVLWAGLGVVCLFGASAYGELGALFPEAGGQYSFLREAWGRFVAFLYGWCFFWVICTGTFAALALAFADNLLALLGRAPKDVVLLKVALAAGMVLVISAVNHFGVQWGAAVQNVSTFAKVAALLLLVAAGWFAGAAAAPAAAASIAPPLTLAGFVAAAVAMFWVYEGWYQLSFNAAELRRPERDLPRGLVWGLGFVVVLYLLVHATYLRTVPIAEMLALDPRSETDRFQVPVRAVARAFDPAVAAWLPLLIAVSVFGSANPAVLSSPRGYYEMAKDGLVPRALLRVSPRFSTPTTAIWVQAAWTIVLLAVIQHFDDVTVYVVIPALVFYALTVWGVYRLRAARPGLARPYRCWGYPLTPALFVAVVLFVVVATLLDPDERKYALVGLAIVATGVPAYGLTSRRS